jgi:hypothetical protein
MGRAGAALAIALLAACSALQFTEAECRGMNWYERGEQEGFGGHPSQIMRLTQQCAKHGVAVPESDYLKGWEAGHDEWYRINGSMGMRH